MLDRSPSATMRSHDEGAISGGIAGLGILFVVLHQDLLFSA